jgi:hypothetical protein
MDTRSGLPVARCYFAAADDGSTRAYDDLAVAEGYFT